MTAESSLYKGTISVLRLLYKFLGNRDSEVVIAIGYGLQCSVIGVRVPIKERIFPSARRLERLPNQTCPCPMGTGSFFREST
jgi:hypothetical protein